MKNKLRLLLAGLALAAASVAHAEQADRTKPMEITSDNGCTMDQIKGVSTCEGNVVVIQGTLRLNADKVVGIVSRADIVSAIAQGKHISLHTPIYDL